ncbi:MAG TPA: radical SAM protein [Sandaracinaceae bacterium LLY-WYZ-13_1]|nr:radical SAM protein [Sandaracinaceae bacterium LLY-WYZ-13_1]
MRSPIRLRDARLLLRVPLFNTFRELGWPRLMPMTMSFVVTDRCNSLCRTCDIGARYQANPAIARGELSLDEYRRLFASIGPFEWATLSGGEPFMRRDLPEIAVALAAACRPRVINVPTNASLVEATTRGIERMLAGFGDTQLIVNLSVDGVGADHDRVRGLTGNFDRLVEVARRLRALDDPRLVLGCNTVISRFNAERVERTVDHVLTRLRPDSYVLEVAQERPEYHNLGADLRGDPGDLRAALARAVARLSKVHRRGVTRVVAAFRAHYYRETLRRLEGPRTHRCFSGFATCAVMARGDVWTSTQRAEPMGNVRDFGYDFPALWRGRDARAARGAVRAGPCDCETANVSYPNALLNPGAAARVAWYALRDR